MGMSTIRKFLVHLTSSSLLFRYGSPSNSSLSYPCRLLWLTAWRMEVIIFGTTRAHQHPSRYHSLVAEPVFKPTNIHNSSMPSRIIFFRGSLTMSRRPYMPLAQETIDPLPHIIFHTRDYIDTLTGPSELLQQHQLLLLMIS